MPGKISITYSSDWNLLTTSTLKKLSIPDGINYPWIYITQNQKRANFLKTEFSETSEYSITPPFTTWNQFINRIYTLLPISSKLLQYSEQVFLIYHAIQNKKEALQFLSPNKRPVTIDVIHQIKTFIQTWQLQGRNHNSSISSPLLDEMILIANEYINLKQDFFIDEFDVINLFINLTTEKEFINYFPNQKTIFREIDTSLSLNQLKVFEKLKSFGLEINLSIYFDENKDFFQNMSSFFRMISGHADNVIHLEEQTGLVKSYYQLNIKKPSLPNKVFLYKYNDRLDEVENTVKRIKKRLTVTRSNPENIVITSPDLPKYTPLLINSLKKYKIPFTISKLQLLAELLPIQHLLLLGEIIHENAELSLIKKLLKSPFFSYQNNLKGFPFEETLNSLRVRFNLELMINQLDKLITFDENRLSHKNYLIESIKRKKAVLQALKQIQEDISQLSKSFSANDYYHFFIKLFEKHQITDRILEWQDNLSVTHIGNLLGALRTFIDSLDLWKNLMNQISPAPKFKIEQSLDVFNLLINTRSLQPLSIKNYGVQIIPPNNVDTLNVDSLYVLGMTDANFPNTGQNPSFDLPEPYEDIFAEGRLYKDRQQFLKFFNCSKKEVMFSFPSQEGETPLAPSGLLMEFKRLTKQKFLKQESIPVYSKGEILEKLNIDTESEIFSERNIIGPETINRFKHQFKILKIRNNSENFGLYEGNLSSEETIKTYLKEYYQDHGFSVSSLENYAQCPMQFFFKRLLRINEPEEFEDWVTPREKGLLVHRVLFRFYSDNPESERTLNKLKLIAEEEIEKLPFLPSVLWDIYKESFLGNNEASKTAFFPAFFDYETNQQKISPLKPIYFEVPFGQFGRRISGDLPEGFNEPFIFEKNGAKLKLKGIVDRVEIGEKGGILIIDYKTGNHPRINDISGGQSLQLPLYLKAISTLLNGGNDKFYPIGAGYYIIKGYQPNELKKEIIFLENKHIGENLEYKKAEQKVSLDAFLDQSIDYAFEYGQGIRDGIFIHTSDLHHCEMGYPPSCPFEAICRINRMKIKQLNSTKEN